MPKKMKGLYLSKKMLHAYPNGFCGAIITGTRGIGKSSFALNAAWEMFREIGMTEDEAWEATLSVCKFTMSEIVSFIEHYASSEEQARCLIWDDAGVHASTMEWWTNRDSLKRLKSVLDTIRTGVSSLILTTPNESDLTKIVRSYDDYIIQIGYSDRGGEYRIAKGYLKRTLPAGQMRIYPKFRNEFRVILPDWVFKKYMARRNQVLVEQIGAVKGMIK